MILISKNAKSAIVIISAIILIIVASVGYAVNKEFEKYKSALNGIPYNIYKMQLQSDTWKMDNGIYIDSYNFNSLSFRKISYTGNDSIAGEYNVEFYTNSSSKPIYTMSVDGSNGSAGAEISKMITSEPEENTIPNDLASLNKPFVKIRLVHTNDEEIIPIELTRIGMLKNKNASIMSGTN